jgi:hypothetical protein
LFTVHIESETVVRSHEYVGKMRGLSNTRGEVSAECASSRRGFPATRHWNRVIHPDPGRVIEVNGGSAGHERNNAKNWAENCEEE